MKELTNGIGVDKEEFDKHLMDESQVDPVEMLIEDHNHVKGNFESFEQSSDEGKEALLKDTLLSLVIHTKLEEEFIYPLMKKVDEDLIGEAEEEHHVVDFVITELKSMTTQDEKLDAKFKVLGELVKHHIKEEESEMFPKLRQQGIDFEDLAQKMIAKKRELKDKYNDLKTIEPVKSDALKPAKKSEAKKTTAKKSAPKKPGTKKAAAKKTTAKKTTAKTSPKKSGTKKTAVKKATAKKASPKKLGTKKTAVKKATAKKSSPKKAGAKKTAAKKPATRKASAKKSPAKKAK
jgi:hypothetical protein